MSRARRLRVLGSLLLAVTPWIAGLSAASPAVAQTAREKAIVTIREARLAATEGRSARSLPIGIFDSGTGGLAVLEEMLRLDQFDNTTHAPKPGGDGRPDFEGEQFVFMGDQANMPYGNYPACGKRSCLVDLALNDAVFLLGREYFPNTGGRTRSRDKLPAKSIIIACNTATAYARPEIEKLIGEAGVEAKVVGIIDGGALGIVESLAGPGEATVGVLATRGTCESGAYPSAILALARQRGITNLHVVQQGSFGLAGAIDGVRDFIDPSVSSTETRPDYRGPSLTNAQDRIEAGLLARYQFDFSGRRMLWEGEPARPAALQINSVENYIAYETVSLAEQLRRNPPRRPLTAVVLGCTHFPYFTAVFARQFRRLRDYQENGQFVYRSLLAEDIRLVDPAVFAARQLYQALAASHELNDDAGPARLDAAPGAPASAGFGRPEFIQSSVVLGRAKPAEAGAPGAVPECAPAGWSQFFVTVPNPQLPAACLDPSGGFTFDYKYGRTAELGATDFLTVPLTTGHFSKAISQRLQRQLPDVWTLLESFSAEKKTAP